MRGARKKLGPFAIPEIVDGMCGRCEYWSRTGDEEDGDCRMLAIWHGRGDHVKRPLPILKNRSAGPLVAAVYDRTMVADYGLYWTEEGGGEVIPAENFSDVPRFYYNDHGEKVKVWSPLRSYSWFGCSRHKTKAQSVDDSYEGENTQRVPEVGVQLLLFG